MRQVCCIVGYAEFCIIDYSSEALVLDHEVTREKLVGREFGEGEGVVD